jgi:hypothetical protein
LKSLFQVEWGDPAFGARFRFAHNLFRENQLRTAAGEHVWEGIRQQNELTAQLCFIVADIAQVRGGHRSQP